MKRFNFLQLGVAFAALLLLLGTGPVLGQEQTGNLHGTVIDQQGDAVPGVTVTLTGIGAPQVRVTNDEGGFRFLNLSPGSYEIKAELEGFSTVERPNIDIRVGRSTTLEVQISAAIEETITVTSESPLLDERKVDRGTSITQIELEKIPTARDPWAIVSQTPGVLTDRINVGGNESGQQAVFTGPGVSDNENSFAVDGVIITDMAAIGASPTYYDFDQFEEMQVSTGGTDIEKVSSGASLNLVTKRGSNNPRGSARFLLTEDEQQLAFLEAGDIDTGGELENGDGNGGLVDQEDARFAGSTVEEVLDFGFEAGGPILRDKLWVWGSYGRNEIAQVAALSGIPDTTTLENSAIKLNGQPVSANSIVASWNRGDKIKIGRLADPGRAFDASWDQDGPSEIWKVEDTHVFSSDFYLTGLYSYVDGGFQLQSKGGSFPSPITTTDSGTALANGETFLDENGIWQNGWYSGTTNRDTDNFQVDGSYFFNTGNLNHELKFGASYRAFETQSNFGWAGGRNAANLTCEAIGTCFLADAFGIPEFGDLLLASRSGETRVDQDYTAAWVQDTLTTGNWTINAGLRYDLQDGENVPSTVEANPLFPDVLPAIDFDGNQGGCVDDNCQFGGDFEWESLSPRVGATYALGAERRTLLRANYSRFAEQLSSGNLFGTNPVGINTVSLLFADSNNNSVYDVGEFALPLGSPPGTFTEVDAGLDPSITDEVSFGAEHAFLPEFVVGVDVTWRNTSDILEGRSFAFDENGNKVIVTRDDYVPDTNLGPNGMVSSDGEDIPHLPDGTPWTAQYWRLRDGLQFAGGSFITNGDREVEYLGASLNFTKRLSNQWMARGFVNYADQEWDVPASFSQFDDPTDSPSGADNDGGLFTVQSAGSGPFGDVLIQSSWSFNLNGMYQVAPDRPWGFNIAANLFGREGYPLNYFYGFSGAVTGDEEPRDAAVTPEVDTFRADDPIVLDLRLEKEMQFTDNLSGILSLDAFNVMDEQYVMQRDRELDAVTANHLTQNLAPRIYRLGFRLNWR